MYTTLRAHFLSVTLIFFSLLSQCSPCIATAGKVLLDINSASTNELAQSLPGIGPAKAKAIVVYREKHGLFQSLDALIEVKGIGPKTLEKIRKFLVVGGNAANQSTATSNSAKSQAGRTQIDTERATTEAVQAVVNVARRDARAIQRLKVLRR